MLKKDKQLLLKDLSARLPYGVICVGITYELDDDGERYIPVKVKDTLSEIHNYKLETASVRLGLISSCKLETVKPYLRSMSSMTNEEKEDFYQNVLDIDVEDVRYENDGKLPLPYNQKDKFIWFENIYLDDAFAAIDWLNAHHFDYRELIEKGLAIEVTEENNPYKE